MRGTSTRSNMINSHARIHLHTSSLPNRSSQHREYPTRHTRQLGPKAWATHARLVLVVRVVQVLSDVFIRQLLVLQHFSWRTPASQAQWCAGAPWLAQRRRGAPWNSRVGKRGRTAAACCRTLTRRYEGPRHNDEGLHHTRQAQPQIPPVSFPHGDKIRQWRMCAGLPGAKILLIWWRQKCKKTSPSEGLLARFADCSGASGLPYYCTNKQTNTTCVRS